MTCFFFVIFRTFRQLLRDEDDDTSVPDVNACVQEILGHIFTSMYNHQVIFSPVMVMNTLSLKQARIKGLVGPRHFVTFEE